jgi:hypothetical protein
MDRKHELTALAPELASHLFNPCAHEDTPWSDSTRSDQLLRLPFTLTLSVKMTGCWLNDRARCCVRSGQVGTKNLAVGEGVGFSRLVGCGPQPSTYP